MKTASEQIFSFEDFELNGAKRTLLKRGEVLSLNSKTFDLLLTLVENHGQILSKNELLDKVWENQFVEENNLTVQISALRKIFGEKKGEHQFIVTIPGKGYKFVAEIGAPSEKSNGLAVLEKTLPISVAENYQTTLIGRDLEIAEIKNLLRQNDVRLLTLTGAGGSGKTSLARTVAGELNADFADGVFFVELAAATEVNFVVSAIAQTLRVTEAGSQSPFETLREFLRTRKLLLILDNFEQVLAAAPIVGDFLAASDSLTILITSRAALHLQNEREFKVLPLDLPPTDGRFSLETADEYAAVALFRRRAQAVKPNFVLTNENAAPIAEICRRLDGLPLAIELAAVRVRLLSPDAILERLEHSLNLLTGGAKGLLSRHRTMRGAIEWSYELLDAEEKSFFRLLAIFAGGFTVEAAEFLILDSSVFVKESAKDERQKTPDVFNLLDSLIDNNLLVSKEQADGNARLRMLEVVREFALEYLENSGEAEIVRRGQAEFFLALTAEAEPFLSGETGNKWLEKLEIEHDNLRAAIQWFLEQEPERSAQMVAGLFQFWINRSYLTEARRWLEAALEKGGHAPTAMRLKLLNSFALVARHQGDYEATRRASEESLAISRTANDLSQIILSCHAVAGVELREENFAATQKLLEEALKISRETGDEKQIAFTLSALSNLFLAEGKPSAARMPIEESLVISRRLNFKVNVNINLTNLGAVAYYEGEIEEAYRHFAESLRIAQEMGNKILVSCCLDGLAAVAAISKNAEQSAKLAGAAESLRESIGYEIEITERLFRDDYLAKVRATLKSADFALAYQTGCALDFSESVALTKNLDFNFSGEIDSVIIIETHQISRIVIEEEIKN